MAGFPKEEVLKRESEFHRLIGRAHTRWGHIESALCQWFERLSQMNRRTSRNVFYAVSGFDGRRRMLLAALGSIKTEPDISDYLRLLINKSGNYSGSRNMLAHGDVLFVDYEGSKHYGNHIILEGSEQWIADPPDDKVLTSDSIDTMGSNFACLAAFVVESLNWTRDTEKLPSRLTELVKQLPHPAHIRFIRPDHRRTRPRPARRRLRHP